MCMFSLIFYFHLCERQNWKRDDTTWHVAVLLPSCISLPFLPLYPFISFSSSPPAILPFSTPPLSPPSLLIPFLKVCICTCMQHKTHTHTNSLTFMGNHMKQHLSLSGWTNRQLCNHTVCLCLLCTYNIPACVSHISFM